MLEAMGIPVEYSFHEDSPSQHEIDLRHTDALSMADSVMTFRLVVKEVAAKQGVHATFMPKPLEGVQGSGMHLHLSLFAGDENAFYDPDDAYNLSKVAKQFIAGLLVHASEITAVTNQTVNSYKRYQPGSWAPTRMAWSTDNRTCGFRIVGSGSSFRIENRMPGADANPYLAFAVLLAAGLKGIEEGYELPPGAEDDVWSLTPAERSAMGITRLPESLGQAITAMERSELVAGDVTHAPGNFLGAADF